MFFKSKDSSVNHSARVLLAGSLLTIQETTKAKQKQQKEKDKKKEKKLLNIFVLSNIF